MNVPQRDSSRCHKPSDRPNGLSAVTHSLCCLLGLVSVATIGVLFYPALIELTKGFQMMASTALVFILVFVWVSIWLVAELVWEWQTQRVQNSD